MDSVDLQRYFGVLRKWWWLLILATALASGVSYDMMRKLPRTYVSTTTILVGNVIDNPTPNGGDFSTARDLAETYSQMASRQPILEATIQSLNLPMRWDQLRDQVLAVHAYGSQTFDIRVTDTNPVRARDIANGIATQLVAASPTEKSRTDLETRRQFIRQELNDLQSEIQDAKTQVSQKQAQLATETTARGVLDREDEINALELKISNWQATYSSLLTTYQGGQGPNDLTVIDPATVPLSPAGPNIRANVAAAGLGGFVLALVGVLAIEYFDDTVKTKRDLEALLGAPVIGLVGRNSALRVPDNHLILMSQPESPTAETYRSLAANLRFASVNRRGIAILVTSPSPGEGKSTTAVNLATALAQSGKKVLLVDMDLRNPLVHKFFGVANDHGVLSLLLNPNLSPAECILETPLPTLKLLVAGGSIDLAMPPGALVPTDALSKFGEQVIQGVREVADFIIVDSPPLLSTTEATILASLTDAALVVAHAGRTRRDSIRAAREVLERAYVPLLGGVLNAAPGAELNLYQYYPRTAKRGLAGRLGSRRAKPAEPRPTPKA
ncbi:MAG TPA: polysaccharide biosynthesis tyrosine autokinase [Chloroflexota bacterium]|nr:polysaccharide biosynthesis tyrosine autokinase [Chloroflexota bacterium]